jgi:hypothetical protein
VVLRSRNFDQRRGQFLTLALTTTMKTKYIIIRALLFVILSGASWSATFDITSYGAVANDSGDDSSAIQQAIDAADASAGTVYIPSGTYKVNTTLVINGTCSVTGDGMNGSILSLTANTNLIHFSASSAGQRLTISDLTLITAQSGAGTALWIEYPSNAPATTGLLAERLQIKDSGSSAIWANGIRLTHAKNSTIRNCLIAGHQTGDHTVAGGNGVLIDGDSSGTAILTTAISYWDTGINVSTALSALTVNRAAIIWAHKGLYASASIGGLVFENNQVDARGLDSSVTCLWEITGSTNASIKNNEFIIGGDADQMDTPYCRYHLVIYGSGISIDGNLFFGLNQAGSVVIMENSTNPTVKDNLFHDLPEGVCSPLWIQSGVTGGTVEGNSFDGCGTTPINDQGTGTTKQYNKVI